MELPALTGLRGIVAFWVVLHHMYYANWLPKGGVAEPLLQRGYLAVDFFFMLSGFVLMHAYGAKMEKENYAWHSLRGFYGARVARVYPLHLCVLGVFLLFLAVPTGVFFSSAYNLADPHALWVVLANAALVQSWLGSDSLIHPAWSASAEIFASALFPFLLFVVLRARPIALVVLCGIGFASLCLLISSLDGNSISIWSGWKTLARCIPEFLIGMVLYRLWFSLQRNAPNGRSPIWSVVFSCAAVALLALILVRANDIVSIGVMSLLIVSAPSLGRTVSALFEARSIRWLGQVSFSIYLVHYPMLAVFTALRGGVTAPASLSGAALVNAVLFLGAVLVSADWSYRHIEIPGRAVTRRVLGLMKAPATISVADDQPGSAEGLRASR
ncbi:MAG TPA: acyltransferase [Beijerinckiaceae bacterium]|nr:acyltransferase [Beijerinckiaceae bacterium]